MKPAELLKLYQEDSRIIELAECLGIYVNGQVHLKNTFGSLRSIIASTVSASIGGCHILILPDKEAAAYAYGDLQNLMGIKSLLFFPASYRSDLNREKTDKSNVLKRTECLEKIGNTQDFSGESTCIVVTYPEALDEQVVSKPEFDEAIISLDKGNIVSQEEIINKISDANFERTSFVGEPGEFSVRGGIIDVFSYSNDYPYRIEIIGDEIASVRTFDPISQESIERVKSITIVPDLSKINEVNQEFHESKESFLGFIPNQAIVWMYDQARCFECIDRANFNDEILGRFFKIDFSKESKANSDLVIDFGASHQPVFNKNFELLEKDLSEKKQKGFKTLILSENTRQINRFYAIFEDLPTPERKNPNGSDDSPLFVPMLLSLHEGFVDNYSKLACYTDHQIFNRYHRFVLKSSFAKKASITLKEFQNLQKGDYVVHIDHGIGQFAGLEKIDVNGKPQEAIRLVYKEGDILYVSIHSLHRISKHSGKDGFEPKIDKLGSDKWKKLKQRTKSKIKDIAKDLIKLYAERKTKIGFEFSPDGFMQTELEASFIYEDTPDQYKAAQATKKDMESISPMDRLVCGDVGFGKTEIAIRAAFKAASDGKQVAILAPTTILTLQHFRTFSERLKDFPVTIDYLNRFKSSKKQKETLKQLEDGKIDIIIGTHRLVSKDVKFKDLGLLIIDEEQKFGVSSKDKLKKVSTNVDTLTLSATPIPRTLQFSLMNARDLSIINTPPPNRYPIHTELHNFDEKMIMEAIEQEIYRGGQVFFVHNRVQNIEEVAGMIKRLCPDADVAIGHGQMNGKQLEDVMLKFIDGKHDVLVATSIIESGLDIPNANTIIINNAHFFGLSDLHQMRGRVGRSNKKAFCYLITPPSHMLSSDAKKRLNTIEEFSELGSGFNIAMRDLDIRGAGNLLGAEQSGFINELGFETYHKILDEAIQELKENEFKDVFSNQEEEKDPHTFVKDCQLETDMELLIPDFFVNSVTERLRLYKDLNEIQTEEKLKEFRYSLEDRFGQVPEQVDGLLNSIRLKWLAAKTGFEKLVLKQGKGIAYFVSDRESPYFQSSVFSEVLEHVQLHPNDTILKEDRNKLILTFSKIHNIDIALDKLSTLLKSESLI